MDTEEKTSINLKVLFNQIKNSMKEIKSSLDFIRFSIKEDKTTLLTIDKILTENKYTLTNISGSITYAIQTLTSTKKKSEETFKSIASTLNSLTIAKNTLEESEDASEDVKQLIEKSCNSLEGSNKSLEKSLSPLKNGFYFLSNSKKLLEDRVQSLKIFLLTIESINEDSLNIVKSLSTNINNELSLHNQLMEVLFYPNSNNENTEEVKIHISEENLNQIKEILESINECNESFDKKDYDEKFTKSKELISSFNEKAETLNEDDESKEEIKTIIGFLNTSISDIETNKKEYDRIVQRWLILGLDSSGKTTILYRLKMDQQVATIPTVGFNDETINYNGYNIRITEIGGQDSIRYLWLKSLTKTRAIIFVVDSSDSDRIDEAKKELHKLLENEGSKDCILLIYANKQDIPEAMKPDEVRNRLELDNIKDRDISIIGSCGTTGEGLNEGIQLVYEKLKSLYE